MTLVRCTWSWRESTGRHARTATVSLKPQIVHPALDLRLSASSWPGSRLRHRNTCIDGNAPGASPLADSPRNQGSADLDRVQRRHHPNNQTANASPPSTRLRSIKPPSLQRPPWRGNPGLPRQRWLADFAGRTHNHEACRENRPPADERKIVNEMEGQGERSAGTENRKVAASVQPFGLSSNPRPRAHRSAWPLS